jgi:hypothetical protein
MHNLTKVGLALALLLPASAALAAKGPNLLKGTKPAAEYKASKPDPQAKQKASIAGAKNAAARKELTQRSNQGNHDSATKSGPAGGPKGDRHDNGIRAAGRAGSNNKKL